MSSKKSAGTNTNKKLTTAAATATTADYPGGDNNHKKQPQRTIQVKIGNQAAKEMTPDQAADYLKLIAAASSSAGGPRRSSSSSSSTMSKSSTGAQVRMTFQNHGTEATLDFGSAAAASGGTVASRSGTTTTITWGSGNDNTTNAIKKKSSQGSTNSNNISSNNISSNNNTITSTLDTNSSSYAAGFRLGQSVANNNKSSSASNSSALVANTSSSKSNNSSINNSISSTFMSNSSNNTNMPCSEKEMKALMSMFIEIMALQMNTDKLNATSPQKFKRREYWGEMPDASVQKLWENKSDVDQASPQDLLAALELGPAHEEPDTKTNEQSDAPQEDSFFIPEMPPLEDIPDEILRHSNVNGTNMVRSISEEAEDSLKILEQRLPNPHNYELKENAASRGIVSGIAVFDFETLERMAMEDALEQEERARKAATAAKRKVWRPLSGTARALDNAAFLEYGGGNLPDNHTNKYSGGTSGHYMDSNSSASAHNTTAMSKDAAKQRSKKCMAWRNRVVACCQSNNVELLMEALEDCPLQSSDPLSLWSPLFVHALPKQRQPLGSNKKDASGGATRKSLLKFLLEEVDPLWFLKPDTRSGRSPLHISCWLGDFETAKAILVAASRVEDKDGNVEHVTIPNLDETCLESGWSCLLYASVAGSLRIVELLLQKGASCTAKTSDSLTWLKSNGQGATPVQFLQHVCLKRKGSKIETYGMAWTELSKDMSNTATRQYEAAWTGIVERLQSVAGQSFSPLAEAALVDFDKAVAEAGKLKEVPAATAKITEKKISESPSTGNNLPASVAAEVSKPESSAVKLANTNNRNKKNKKGTGAGPSEAGVKITSQSDEAPKVHSLEDDPLTVLLMGMGFEQKPVVRAIQALGGVNKATPDTVIAWMFDNQEQVTEAPTEEVEQKEESFEAIVTEKATRTASLSKKAPRNKSRTNSNTSAAVTNTKQQQPPAPMDAEKRLQAKREEQRRRNREWNKKQEEAANPVLQGAAASLRAPPAAVLIPSMTHMTSASNNDVSTVASSEVFANDDATISTLESRSTQHQQPTLVSGLPMQQPQLPPQPTIPTQPNLPMAAPFAPPGFSGLAGSSTSLGGSAFLVPRPTAATIPPPGIPETKVLPSLGGYNEGAGLLSGLLHMPPASSQPAPAPVTPHLFPVAGEHLGNQTHLAGLQQSNNPTSSLLGGVPMGRVPIGTPTVSSSSSGSLFGSNPPSSSLTGSSLWNDAPLAPPDGSGSFLLGNVIPTAPQSELQENSNFLFNNSLSNSIHNSQTPPNSSGWGAPTNNQGRNTNTNPGGSIW